MRELALICLLMVFAPACSGKVQPAQKCPDCVKDTGNRQVIDSGEDSRTGDTGDVGDPRDTGDVGDLRDTGDGSDLGGGGPEDQVAVRLLGAACGDWERRPTDPAPPCPSRPLTVEWVLSFEAIDVPYTVKIGDNLQGSSAANLSGEICFAGSPYPSQPGCISHDGVTTWKAPLDDPETSVIGGPAVASDGAMYWLLGNGLLARRQNGAQGMEEIAGLWNYSMNIRGDAKLTIGPDGVLAALGWTSTDQRGVVAVSRCGAKVWEVDGATDILFADASGFWLSAPGKIVTISADGNVIFTLRSDKYISAMPLAGGSVAFSSCVHESNSTRCELTLASRGSWPEGARAMFSSLPRRTGRDSLVMGWAPSEGLIDGGHFEVFASSEHFNIDLQGRPAGEPVVAADGSMLISRILPNGNGPRGLKTVLYDYAADGHENGQITLDNFAKDDQEPLVTLDGRIYITGSFLLSDGERIHHKHVVMAMSSSHCGATGSFWTRSTGNMAASRFSE